MARYFSRPKMLGYVEDEYCSPDAGVLNMPTVNSHEAIDTGLLDSHGDKIWRAPNAMGFGRDEEWG